MRLSAVLAGALLAAAASCSVAARGGVPGEGKTGSAAADPATLTGARDVVIGLFLPTKGAEAEAGREALKGAEMAAARANRDGGIRGRQVRLVTAPSDVAWSLATDSLVRLIYDEGAVAIVGALDGRTGHLAEQVITRAKGQTVFVTPWASETTLTRIRIPWYFQMVPDDRRQGEALAREIFQVRRLKRAAIYMDKGLDPESAADAFEKYAPEGSVTRFQAGDAAAREDLLKRAGRGDFGAVVLFTNAGAAVDLARSLSRSGSAPALVGPLALARPEFLRPGSGGTAEGTLLLAPAGLWSAPLASEFRRDFQQDLGVPPTLLAAYTHDAVKVLVDALRTLPTPESDGLAEALAGIRTGGVTGEIRFDNRLGRDAVPILARVSRNDLVPLGAAVPAGRK